MLKAMCYYKIVDDELLGLLDDKRLIVNYMLRYAICADDIESVKMYLRHGADVKVLDNHALKLALVGKNEEMIELLGARQIELEEHDEYKISVGVDLEGFFITRTFEGDAKTTHYSR